MATRTTTKKPVKTTGKPKHPDFNGDRYAEEFWEMSVGAYEGFFSQEDTPLLTLACHAWSRYKTAQEDLESCDGSDVKLEAKIEARHIKWFDRVKAMLAALGMTPCQRKNSSVPPGQEGAAVEGRPSDLDD